MEKDRLTHETDDIMSSGFLSLRCSVSSFCKISSAIIRKGEGSHTCSIVETRRSFEKGIVQVVILMKTTKSCVSKRAWISATLSLLCKNTESLKFTFICISAVSHSHLTGQVRCVPLPWCSPPLVLQGRCKHLAPGSSLTPPPHQKFKRPNEAYSISVLPLVCLNHERTTVFWPQES